MASKSAASSLATVTTTLSLAQLRPGHEAVPPVNIRAPEDGPELRALAAPAEPEGSELPRAARQSLSLVANRAAAATIAADADLALTLLAAAWIAREDDVHATGNAVPLVVASRGLGEGPAADMITALADGDAGRPHRWQKDERTPYFAGLAAVIAGMTRGKRLELVAALAAGALDLSHDTVENRSGTSKHVKADGVAALLAALPVATFHRNAQLILAGAGEAEAAFGDWGKAHLVEAIRDMDGDAAARQAAKAKKPDLVALVAERVRATGWLPQALRLAAPATAEGSADEREAA
jgi:hypothetical protein